MQTGTVRSSARMPVTEGSTVMSGYLDNSGREDVLSGGARMIPVDTPAGRYRVWVKRTGNHPGLRVLLLHGGPGATHEYLEACDSYLPGARIEFYRAATCSARTAATWPCTTTRRCTSAA